MSREPRTTVAEAAGTVDAQVVERLRTAAVVPSSSFRQPSSRFRSVEALVAAGLPCAEITFRTPAAREGLEAVRQAFPDVLLGAGTVVSVEQLDEAIAAGANFVVAPGTSPPLVELCRSRAREVVDDVLRALAELKA